MLVGFMRNYKQPILLAKMLSIHCKYYNIELLYFNPQDVDIDSQTINGKIFVKGNWKTVSRPIPKFIDISPYCFKYRKVVDFLKSKADLSNDYHNWLDKNLLQKILQEDNNFNHLAIPTYEPTTGEEIENYLDDFHKIILKPTGGQEGKNVYAVIKEGVNFRLLHKSSERLLEKKEFEEFLDKEIIGQEYILQKNINSLTKQGFPFDCRIHVEKNSKGKWEIAKAYVRIGLNEKVVSNISRGGAISNPKKFLKANYPEDWEQIYEKLESVGESVPYMIEKYRGKELMVLGIDVGIDSDKKPYIFEVNTAPIVAPLKAEVVMLRSSYYNFKVSKGKKINNAETSKKKHNNCQKKISKIERLEKNILKHEKELSYIKNSLSWRITKPLRLLKKAITK